MMKGDEKCPLVSIIVPMYNAEQFVGETLRSIEKVDYPAIEVVIVDDGSTDGSAAIAQRFVDNHANWSLIRQPNRGVSAARNLGIRSSYGKYILPVDADNLLAVDFITLAVSVLEYNPDVKVVAPTAEYFGDRSGVWKLPEFSLKLLARRNLMDTCALYRRADYDRCGGYCEELMAREDWDFWISMLKDGGEVVRLPEIGFYYRYRKTGSKRFADRKLKRHVVDMLNARHPEFFSRQLGGPLRYSRSWSRVINKFCNLFRCK